MHRGLVERLAGFVLVVVVSRAWRAHSTGRGR
ncbi:hypothetical protein Gobs01_04940 [Geodermatophilus obscurus DSM 43160]|uniref:Uncharacterized protein n=1 Tax=Geodermatophilus obscurus (strain ATCC 25078 / DSM 43160 / JCM 3152 / CCUG 61914 / KCC A-0152 / KCTC 9177 / NBRC 13315 / NRRL B-3577 / G-20) TaxID=526225 RepID=D2SE82_GEOOG|nr:hypothetical protein Gobs_1849 [Geodermatophilus obscurus DSM 43160]